MFKNHPKGLIPAALSNMGERFGYYIMNAVLTLFLCSKFGFEPSTGALIYSFFYAGIYVLSLAGGLIADKLQNYKGTIMAGLIVMAAGYSLLSIPIMSTSDNATYILIFTCIALFLIAFGNGLFKGNLQAIVGQMYDNLEKEKSDNAEELKRAKGLRDTGFQIFYVFINIGGLIAPFVAPLLRGWWLKTNGLLYNADLSSLCHKFLKFGESMIGAGANSDAIAKGTQQFANLTQLANDVTLTGASVDTSNLADFCSNYLNVFNTGVHYSFIASVAAMIISLIIFIGTKKIFPNPTKKEKVVSIEYTPKEKADMAKEIKQRIMALFAVLGVVVFFWFSFHQNGVSLSYFARDFINTTLFPPEIWQAINPFFVIVLTPFVIWLFSTMRKKGKEPSTPMKIAIGMGIAGLGFVFLSVISKIQGLPSYNEYQYLDVAAQTALKCTPWILVGMYFFLTVAELFISPLGLSFVSKVAPKHMQGLCQGLWLSATAVGNILLFLGGILYEKIPLWLCWVAFVAVCLISMVVMLSMVRWLERITK
ncbi:MAG: peptide MFS transporter [Prevotellaceae bacterium]|jgi:POT family proton-dependent oligopeptide transporter|nr:peptide MFS transporter [Prevotellaceae bacterium]